MGAATKRKTAKSPRPAPAKAPRMSADDARGLIDTHAGSLPRLWAANAGARERLVRAVRGQECGPAA